MKRPLKFALILSAIILLLSFGYAHRVQSAACQVPPGTTFHVEPVAQLSHAQTVWKHALEWCESSGRNGAINAVDLDGTPSYGAWQFKPSTFYAYAERYGIDVPTPAADEHSWMDYETQSLLVEHMILDPKVRWEREFPHCIEKLGRPPRY
jgi:hypothetical protein